MKIYFNSQVVVSLKDFLKFYYCVGPPQGEFKNQAALFYHDFFSNLNSEYYKNIIIDSSELLLKEALG